MRWDTSCYMRVIAICTQTLNDREWLTGSNVYSKMDNTKVSINSINAHLTIIRKVAKLYYTHLVETKNNIPQLTDEDNKLVFDQITNKTFPSKPPLFSIIEMHFWGEFGKLLDINQASLPNQEDVEKNNKRLKQIAVPNLETPSLKRVGEIATSICQEYFAPNAPLHNQTRYNTILRNEILKRVSDSIADKIMEHELVVEFIQRSTQTLVTPNISLFPQEEDDDESESESESDEETMRQTKKLKLAEDEGNDEDDEEEEKETKQTKKLKLAEDDDEEPHQKALDTTELMQQLISGEQREY